MIRHARLLPAFLWLAIALLAQGAAADSEDATRLDQQFPRSSLQIATPDARLHRFDIWIADTDRRRQQGLMFVKHLEEDEAMLFIYPRSQRVGIWMKNTYIPLDILFVRTDGRVARVVENATPHSTDTIDSGEPVVAVVELKGGSAERLKIRPGAQVIHPAFAPE